VAGRCGAGLVTGSWTCCLVALNCTVLVIAYKPLLLHIHTTIAQLYVLYQLVPAMCRVPRPPSEVLPSLATRRGVRPAAPEE
jgi:hypothetical protein